MLLLPHDAASATRARRSLVQDLSQHGLPVQLIADAELVLAEMVGNAIRHAQPMPDGRVHAGWEVCDQHVMLHVTDGGARTRPQVTEADDDATSGRGLAIVAALSDRWGADSAVVGVNTWATLDVPA